MAPAAAPVWAGGSSRAAAPRRELATRVASAMVMVPVGLGLLAIGGPAWDLLILLMVAAAAFEWAGMAGCRPQAAVSLVLFSVATAGLLGLAAPLAGMTVLAAGVIWLVVSAGSAVALGLPYVALAGMSLIWLRLAPHGGAMLVLFVMLTVWASDTGAYVAGRRFGGRKLAPLLSPSKTWSGAMGGLLAAALVGIAFALLGPRPAVAGGMAGAVLLGGLASVMLGIAAQVGDLVESAAKRRFAVKDSGRLIPGHGGVLDRMDGLMAASLLAACVVWGVVR